MANSPETGFVGVYMYCDDQAAIKQLPLNMRATQIAAEAGQALQVGAAGDGGRGFKEVHVLSRCAGACTQLTCLACCVNPLGFRQRSNRGMRRVVLSRCHTALHTL